MLTYTWRSKILFFYSFFRFIFFGFVLRQKKSVFLLSFLVFKKVLLVPSAQWTGCNSYALWRLVWSGVSSQAQLLWCLLTSWSVKSVVLSLVSVQSGVFSQGQLYSMVSHHKSECSIWCLVTSPSVQSDVSSQARVFSRMSCREPKYSGVLSRT